MTKLTQKQLIESLSQLKEIKPNQEWASLLKSQILSETKAETKIIAQKASFMDAMASVFTTRKLAYALSAFLFLVVGVFGITKFLPTPQVVKQPAALTSPTVSRQEVADLNTRVTALTKNLKTTSLKDPIIAQKLSDEVQKIKQLQAKSFADVTGTTSTQSTNDAIASANNSLEPIVASEIKDLKKATLTEDQKKTLIEIEDLYKQGKYADALEKILLISK